MTSAALSTFSEIFAFVFQSFRLTSVLPSFLFLSLNIVFILPVLPQEGLIARFLSSESSDQLAITIVLSFLLGYLLSIMNVPLIRLFEGYPWRETWYGRVLIQAQKDSKQRLNDEVRRREQIIADLEAQLAQYELGDPRREDLFMQLQPQIQALRDNLNVSRPMYEQLKNNRFPLSREPFLPSALGNTIASFEDYPNAQYKIDAVILWPRLVPTLTKEKFSIFIEREKANLDFVLNLCFFLLLFGFEIAYVGLIFADDFVNWLIAAIGVVGIIYFVLYKIAIVGAYGWGMSVRVAFDLYRYHLLAAIFGETPKDFKDERTKWAYISKFFREGLWTDHGRVTESDMSQILDYSQIKALVSHMDASQKEDK